MTSSRVTGLDAVRRVFKALPEEVAKRLRADMQKSLYEIKGRAELLVPRDQEDLAGTLDTQITTRTDGRAIVGRVVAGTTPETAIAAYRQEFGRAPGPGEHRGHTDQPFLFPAYWAVRKRVRARMARAVRRAARAVAQKR